MKPYSSVLHRCGISGRFTWGDLFRTMTSGTEAQMKGRNSQMLARVVVLFGLPASGKTTLCRCIFNLVQKKLPFMQVEHLEYDQFRLKNYGQGDAFSATQWKEGGQDALSAIIELLEVFHREQSRKPLLLLVDDTFHLRSLRKEFYKIICKCRQMNIE